MNFMAAQVMFGLIEKGLEPSVTILLHQDNEISPLYVLRIDSKEDSTPEFYLSLQEGEAYIPSHDSLIDLSADDFSDLIDKIEEVTDKLSEESKSKKEYRGIDYAISFSNLNRKWFGENT